MRTLVEAKTTATKNAAKTHCSQDRPYDQVNMIKYRDRRGSMTPLCRTCIYERNRSRRVRRRAEGAGTVKVPWLRGRSG